MYVIGYKRSCEFGRKYTDCRALDDWFKVAIKANWSNLIEVQSVFPTAVTADSLTIFTIKGNKYRLIVSIDYAGQLIYIKCVLTHADYDQERWNHDAHV